MSYINAPSFLGHTTKHLALCLSTCRSYLCQIVTLVKIYPTARHLASQDMVVPALTGCLVFQNDLRGLVCVHLETFQYFGLKRSCKLFRCINILLSVPRWIEGQDFTEYWELYIVIRLCLPKFFIIGIHKMLQLSGRLNVSIFGIQFRHHALG